MKQDPPQRFQQSPKPAHLGDSVTIGVFDFSGITWPCQFTITWTLDDGTETGQSFSLEGPLDATRTLTVPANAAAGIVECFQSQDYGIIIAP